MPSLLASRFFRTEAQFRRDRHHHLARDGGRTRQFAEAPSEPLSVRSAVQELSADALPMPASTMPARAGRGCQHKRQLLRFQHPAPGDGFRARRIAANRKQCTFRKRFARLEDVQDDVEAVRCRAVHLHPSADNCKERGRGLALPEEYCAFFMPACALVTR